VFAGRHPRRTNWAVGTQLMFSERVSFDQMSTLLPEKCKSHHLARRSLPKQDLRVQGDPGLGSAMLCLDLKDWKCCGAGANAGP